MSFYALTALINAIAASAFGLFVYFKNPKRIINKTFGLFSLSVAVWSYSYFFWQISTTETTALFWTRALMVGAIFIPIFYFHFILGLLNKIQEKKKLLITGYLFFSFFFLANFTSFFVEGVRSKLNFDFWPDPGILYHPFLILWFFYLAYTIYLLIKSSSTSSGILKNQLRYILLGTIVGYLGGITNYLLWYDIPVPPVGNWTATFYLGIVAYAIVTTQLFGIRVILTQFLVGVIAILLLFQAITADNLIDFVWKITLFLSFLIFGYFLIRSVIREIQRRAELQRLYKEVDKLSKAKSEFISIASHQLRTPLTAVKGYISMIVEGTYGKLSEKLEKPLKNVYQSNERLIKLVNDLLSLSRLEAGKLEFKPEPTSLEKMIPDIVEELKINAEKKGLYIKIVKPSKLLPKTMIDQDKLRQVILNIIDNAIKYTKKGGITIELKKLDSREQIKISDTGEGMDREEIKSLFQMFSRATAGTQLHREGAGIGLYVAKRFVDMHNGKIWVESPGKDKGSTFYIELPIK